MERAAIEQLLADYVNGSITDADRLKLEALFKQDEDLKAEAAEMLTLWQSLDIAEPTLTSDTKLDGDFYAMLQTAKSELPVKNRLIINLNKTWLTAAAVIIMFYNILCRKIYRVTRAGIQV